MSHKETVSRSFEYSPSLYKGKLKWRSRDVGLSLKRLGTKQFSLWHFLLIKTKLMSIFWFLIVVLHTGIFPLNLWRQYIFWEVSFFSTLSATKFASNFFLLKSVSRNSNTMKRMVTTSITIPYNFPLSLRSIPFLSHGLRSFQTESMQHMN